LADQNFRVKRGLEVGVGATVLTTTAAGNIGVGSTNPQERLDVQGGNGFIRIGEVYSTYNGITLNNSTVDSDYNFISSPADRRLFINSPTGINFRIADADRFLLSSSGNLGINSTSPTSRLDVVGDVKVSGVITATTFSGNATTATFATNAGIATNLKGGLVGNIPYQSAADTTAFLANGSLGSILQSNGVGSIPSWVPAAPSNAITGLTIRDEGTIIGTANSITQLNFVGSTVSAAATAGIATITISFADFVSTAGFATVSGISTSVIGGIASVSQLNVSGVGTVGSLNIGATQVISSARQLQNIASLDATTTATIESAIANAPNTFTDLQVTGVSTFTNGSVLIGSGTSTGTASQRLQVTGGAYVSGSVGIGSTNPTSKLDVVGDVKVSGVVTATTFSGTLLGYASTAGIATNLKGGSGGTIVYQSAADTTAFLANGSLGQVLQASGGTNPPSWVDAAPSNAITGLTIRDEGTIVSTANSFSQLNFVGNIVSVAGTGPSGIATITFADFVSTAGFATISGISTSVIGGIASVSQLNVSGVATIGVVTANNLYVAGVGTFLSSGLKIRNLADTFQYNITGGAITANRTLNLPVITATDTLAALNISQTFTNTQTFNGTLSAASLLSLSGNTSGTHLFGTNQTSGTLTFGGTSGTGTITFGRATTSQTTDIQAGATASGNTKTINLGTGGLSGSFTNINIGPTAGVGTVVINTTNNVGIGSLLPTSVLDVVGDAKFTGVVTATSFSGNATTATALQNARDFSITGNFVTATAISFNGTGNVALAATITPNSIGLGTYTSGDYVQSISGTANQITVTSGTGEGSTPTLSVPNQFTAPEDVTVTRDLQVNRNLNVNGNITIGGTAAVIFSQSLNVFDPDIVLGYRTDANGNDVSNDNTANHGGVAVASTEGTPLVQLFIAGIETNPATYKKIMWFKSGTFAGLGTDAWLSNYAVGIGSTQFPTGTRFASGAVQFTESDLAVVRNINASGITTSSRLTLNGANSATTGGGQIYLNGASGNRIDFNTNGAAAPTFTTRSAGTKIVLYPSVGASKVDYAFGINANVLWSSVEDSGSQFKWYAGTTQLADLKGSGELVIGSSTLTGTASQLLQVNSGGYFNGSVGIGTTNPTSKLHVVGDTLVTGVSTFQSDVYLGDNDKILLGDGNDLRIYHDGSNSFVEDSGTGNLYLQSNAAGIILQKTSGNENLAKFLTDGAVELYYDNSKEFETTGYGATVYGTLQTQQLNVSGIATASTLVATKSAYLGSDYTNSTFGNGWIVAAPASTTYYKIATLPETSSATFDHLTIEGVMGGWVKDAMTPFKMTFSNRDGFDYKYESYGSVKTEARIIGISTNNTTEIWAQHQSSQYTKLVYNITDSVQVTVVANPTSTTTAPIGTTVFDSSSVTYTPRFIINESDNVGIGTASPTSKLHVVGDTLITGIVTATTFIGALTGTATTSSNVIGGIGSLSQLQVTGISTFTNGPVLIGAATSTNTAAQRLQVTGGAYVSSSLGIGVTNPAYKLSVYGNSAKTSTDGSPFVISSNDATNPFQFLVSRSSSSVTKPYWAIESVEQGVAYRNLSLLSAGGNVTIGSTLDTGTASQRLQVNGGGYFAGVGVATGSIGVGITNPQGTIDIRTAPQWSSFNYGANLIIGGSRNNGIGILDSGNTNPWAIVNGSGNLLFAQMPALGNTTSPSSEAARITSNRNLLIGATTETGTSSQLLQVSGGAYVSGSVGIGTTNPSDKLHVLGGKIRVDSTSGGLELWSGAGFFGGIGLDGSTNILLKADATRSLIFQTGGANDRGRIDSSGTFLVGTATSTGTANQKLQVSGGAYVSGSVGIGTTVPTYILTVTDTGTSATSGLTNCLADFTTTANSYAQINLRNTSSGTNASSDVIITANNGSDTTNFIDLGINNSGFSVGSWTINGANDGYLYTSDGNLSIGAINASVAKYISFFTGGTLLSNERMRINAIGVGIGSTNPTSKLDVVGDAKVSGVVTATTFIGALTGTATTSSNVIGGIGSLSQLQVTGISTFTNGPVLIGSGTSTGTASQRLQVTGGAYVSGRLGVANTNPSYDIDVTGSIGITTTSGDALILSSTLTNGRTSIVLNTNGNDWELGSRGSGSSPINSFYIYDRNASAYRQVIDPSGNVLFGATSATGTASQLLQVTGGGYFSGSVGIGSTNPQSTLSVGGTITELYAGTYWNVVTQADVGYGSSQVPLNQYLGQLAFLDDFSPNGLRREGGGSDDVGISSIGYVGIGTTNPTSKLHVVGDGYFTGIVTATDFNSASDENLKTNIVTIDDPLDKIVQIRGVNFEWRENGRRSAGVIAQEIEKVLPELVNGGETKTVNYNGLIGLLIEAIKAQQEEIDILKEKIK